jgi:predicted component of viral defense system (DUF524 family)
MTVDATPHVGFVTRVLGLTSLTWSVPLENGVVTVRLLDHASRTEEEQVWALSGAILEGEIIAPEHSSDAPLVYDERESPLAISPFRVREQTEYGIEVDWTGEGTPPDIQCFPQLYPPILKVERVRHRHRMFRARLNFRDYVGATSLVLEQEGREVFSVELEVRSRKLGYLDDYVALLDDLSARSVGILLRPGSPVFAPFRSRRALSDASGFVLFLVLRHLLRTATFAEAIECIARTPASSLGLVPSRRVLGRHTPRNMEELSKGIRQGAPLLPLSAVMAEELGVPALPQTFPSATLHIDRASEENRFVSALLQRLSSLLQHLQKQLQGERVSGYLREVVALQEVVTAARLRCPDLTDLHAGLMGQIPRKTLQRLPGYRDLLAVWDALEAGLVLAWDDAEERLAGPLRDLAQLYELWCFFVLWEALSTIAETTEHSPWSWRTGTSRFHIRLKKGAEAPCVFRFADAEVRLYYQRRFAEGLSTHHSYSISLTPDYTVEVCRVGQPPMLLCFDAKYRPDGALEKMHAYRDALRGALGCYLFYPGESAVPTLFHRHPDFPLPGVGAFSLRPKGDGVEWLTHFLRLALQQMTGTLSDASR